MATPTGTITITGVMSGFDNNAYSITLGQATINSGAAVGEVRSTVLGSGDTTLIIPPGTTAIMIQPPSGNTVAISVKVAGVGATLTGIPLSKVNCTLLALDALPVSPTLVITAAAAITGPTKVIFM